LRERGRPSICAGEAVGQAKITNDAKATEVFDASKYHYDSLEPESVAEVGSQSADTIKFYFREHCGARPRGIGIERLRDPPTEWSRQFVALGLNPG
jgi:hypothetical protein